MKGAWTSGGSGNISTHKTSFSPAGKVRYVMDVNNLTTRAETVTLVFTVRGPGGPLLLAQRTVSTKPHEVLWDRREHHSRDGHGRRVHVHGVGALGGLQSTKAFTFTVVTPERPSAAANSSGIPSDQRGAPAMVARCVSASPIAQANGSWRTWLLEALASEPARRGRHAACADGWSAIALGPPSAGLAGAQFTPAVCHPVRRRPGPDRPRTIAPSG